MGNFDFLSRNPRFTPLAEAAASAEKLLPVNAAACAIHCRRAVEISVKWLYSVDSSLPRPWQEQLAVLMGTREFRDLVGRDLWQRLDFIRKLGNAAVHTHKTITRDMAVLVLRHVHGFLQFVAGCYDPAHSPALFDAALLPDAPGEGLSTESKEVGLADLMAQNAALRKELTALREQRRNQCVPRPEPSEYLTRKIYIDAMLLDAGWTEGDDWRNEVELDGLPSKTGTGFADYVLYGDDGMPLAVIEAKRTCVDPSKGRQQAKLYADALERWHGRRPVVFLSNGYDTFLDDQYYPERRVAAIYSKRDLERLFNLRASRVGLAGATVAENIADRHYQKAAVTAVCENMEARRRKALLVMATGSGKTRTVIALCDVLIRRGWIRNILFLADRTSLVTQAKRAFTNLQPNLSVANLVTEKDKSTAHCIFSTYQTMFNSIDSMRDDAGKVFTCGHFDLVICDEAHRSIYNKYQDIFNYFDAPLVGLTATPKDEIDKNTYEIFELENGVPTFGYELDEAVRDGFLVPHVPVETRLQFLERGIIYDELSEEDRAAYEATFAEEEDGLPESINASALNSWLFNEDTIRQVLQIFMENGLKINYGERIGKTIIFAKNHAHAEKILQIFGKYWPHLPNCAKVIDNYMAYAQSAIDDFATAGKMPQIAISVDMLDTGIDIPEVLNLVFFKKVLSKAKFWQMIGRGTRLCPGLLDGSDKQHFYIFDFCGNFAFFRMNEGQPVAAQSTLQAALYNLKAQIVHKLQELEHQTDYLVRFRAGLVEELVAKAKALDVNHFAVRQHRRAVEKFARPETWQAVTYEAVVEAQNEVAPLVLPDEDEAGALRFDALLYGIELARIVGQKHIKGLADLTRKAAAMTKVASIPEVRAQADLLDAVLHDDMLKTAGVAELEHIRESLRGLVKYLQPASKRYDTNFTDNILGIDWEVPQPPSGTLENYRAKVEAYVRQHVQDNPVIVKLHTNVPLTSEDMRQLEGILWNELGTREDYEQNFGQKPLGEFVREIVGLDMNAAKQAFSQYLNNASLDSRQIYFVNQIVEYIVHNGMMKNLSVIQNEPFIKMGTINEIFVDEKLIYGIKESIDLINKNMIAA